MMLKETDEEQERKAIWERAHAVAKSHGFASWPPLLKRLPDIPSEEDKRRQEQFRAEWPSWPSPMGPERMLVEMRRILEKGTQRWHHLEDAIQYANEMMADELRALGYEEAIDFLNDEVCQSYEMWCE